MYSIAPKGDLKFYTFAHLESSGLVAHGFTTRVGGVGTGYYDSLNTSFNVGDDDFNVRQNRDLACRALGINPGHLVAGRQVHGDGIRVVEKCDMGKGAFSYEDSLPDTDALITGLRGVPLSSYYADCVPVFFLDPVRKVVALAHAGWKGTVLKIGLKVVERMAGCFGTDPLDCLAGVGPSIGPCCYEIDEPVMSRFRDVFHGGRQFAEAVAEGKWKLNLWEANRATLIEAGLKPENVLTSRLCTSCHGDLFFSHRAQKGRTGRMASLIMLK
ncbi:peptidoglycan editing factor PgeF [Pelotomaculum propionicicum]|uniref:peptidoglycan editing factor PgeF n=1 Tax=Pelotomaculum propionicicum TaxID=258475 RepID=UPI003B7D7EAE